MAYMTIPASAGNALHTLPSNANTWDIDVNGEQDGDYEFWYDITVAAAASNTLSLQPNALATNQVGQLLIGAANAASAGDAGGVMYAGAGSNAGSNTLIKGHGWLTSKTGRVRHFHCQSRYNNGSGTQIVVWCWTDWTATSTAITSLRWNTGSGMIAGSEFRLRKLGNST